jgi:hypothetical protein
MMRVVRIGGEAPGAPGAMFPFFSRHNGHRGAGVAPLRIVIDMPSSPRAETKVLQEPLAETSVTLQAGQTHC